MDASILSLHHVTATVDHAQEDLDFCIETLGMRLLKKTVNFDNHHVYHFYYGDERGTPGTLWTTFPYHGRGIPTGTKGAGQITVTSFSVPAGSLDFWKARLRQRNIVVHDNEPRFGEESIVFIDPSGLVFELVANDRDRRMPWTTGAVPVEAAIRGLHGVTMTLHSSTKTVELMTGVLGFEIVNETKGRIRLAVNGDEPGKTMEILLAPDAIPARNGLGTVHHVALATSSGDEQRRFRKELLQFGYRVTEVLDRQYFQSIYFREPGGVLFEIATTHPGFMADESFAELGQNLKLPPWEESNRSAIEAGLAKVEYRRGQR
jgi:glyoxalase family protein